MAVALLSRDLAALAGGMDQDTAYQAGLLHDVGKPVLCILLLELERSQHAHKRRAWLRSEV